MSLAEKVGKRSILLVVLVVVTVGIFAAAPSPVQAYPRPGPTERVSVATGGAQGNGNSAAPRISADGRYVAFQSFASNLVPGDTNGVFDAFVHDRATGATERVSVASGGAQGNGNSWAPSISADGRYVAFQSSASNLVPGDTNGIQGPETGSDVFVHDRATGATERVSVSSGGAEANGSSYFASISAAGGHVAFYSSASNLVPGDANGAYDVFVHDRATGATERVSVASGGAEGNGNSEEPSISADGRYVAFNSGASNLIPGDNNGAADDVFVHDRATGVTERVSVATGGAGANSVSEEASISADGRHVAFRSFASNLVPDDTNGTTPDVFVHDRATGVTERVSVSSGGAEPNGSSWRASISADGRHVAFNSQASNLVPGDANEAFDAFVHDRATGATERVSVGAGGAEANGSSWRASISADGRRVAFQSDASNLVPGDANSTSDVFVYDRGPALGVAALSAIRTGETISVSGWATFSGRVLSSADDPSDDGVSGAKEAGAELTGASLTYRPEVEDLLARLQLASLGSDQERCTVDDGVKVCEQGGGAPGVLAPGLPQGRIFYGLGFELDGIDYEIRARGGSAFRLASSSLSQRLSDPQHFTLYRCDPDCDEQVPLGGGIGTTGSEVRFAVPLVELGASEGESLTRVRAFTAKEEDALEPGETLDEMALPDAPISVSHVELGVAPASAPEGGVSFGVAADLLAGEFSGTIPTVGLSPGAYRVWARACLGDACGPAAAVPVTLGEVAEQQDTNLELTVEGRGQDMTLRGRLTVVDAPSEGIEGRTIDFYSDGELIGSAQSDDDGVAAVAVPPGHRGANRTYEAVFAGDDLYRASSDERPGEGPGREIAF